MKENIETKDVQRTEYLDKNGLDMLWAKVKENTHNQVEVERNRAVAKEDNITNSLSDFVSKTTTDAQIINSALGIVGGIIQIVDSIADENPVNAELGSNHLEFDGSDRSTIELNGYDVNSNKRSRITIEAFNENPQILLNNPSNSDTTFQNYLKITNEGISSLDNNANHVYATDGSIADLTQYAKKSESVDNTALAALEAKVTDNTTAITNINVSKGIPYDASVTDKYQTDKDLSVKNSNGATADFGPNNGIRLSNENFEFGVNITDCVKFSIQNDTIYSKIGPFGLEAEINDDTYTHCSSDSFLEIKNRENRINLQPAYLSTENGDTTILMNHEQILIKSNDNTQIMLTPYQLLMKEDDSQVILNSNGINLPNGDNNHVLTSNASTIDITQYVLKSVYDEKIAALEARIAALEAKHTETA